MSKKYTVIPTRPGELVSLVELTHREVPGETPDEPPTVVTVQLSAAYITRRNGDYALVDRSDGSVLPGWPPSAVDALIEYRASRVQGVVPPVDPTDA